MEEKAKGSGSVAAIDNSLSISQSGEMKLRRGRSATGKRLIAGEENRITEGLAEPAAITENLSEQSNEITPVPREKKQRRHKENEASLPRRSSKRLAGMEAAPATDLVVRRPSLKQPSNSKGSGVEEALHSSVPSSEAERTGTVDEAPQPFVPLSEPERTGILEEAYQPFVPLSEPSRTSTLEEASQPFVPLSEPERTGVVAEAYQAFVPLWEPERMETVHKAYQPSHPLSEPERPGTVEAANQPFLSFSEPERPGTMEAAYQPFLPFKVPERPATAVEASRGKRVLVTGQTSEAQLPLPPPAFSFDDPCIEFAIKTLMGDIPVLDEGLAIQEYVQKQLSSAKALNPSPPSAAVASSNQGLDLGKQIGSFDLPKQQHLHVNSDGGSVPPENRRRSLENRRSSQAETSRVRG